MKDFLLKWAGLIALGIFFGRYAIPESSKVVWRTLESWRFAFTLLAGAAEMLLAAVIAYKIYGMLRLSDDADHVLEQAIGRRFSQPLYAGLALFEARIWYYGLFLRKGERLRFSGQCHFAYAKNEGNASSQLGFIIGILFELPLVHMMVHFAFSPVAALTLSALTAYGLLYRVAEYRATFLRPVSLDSKHILVRCGVLSTDAAIPYTMVLGAARIAGEVKRAGGVRRYRQMGRLNLEITLQAGSELPDLLGRMRPVSRVCLSLDHPDAFLKALHERLALPSQAMLGAS